MVKLINRGSKKITKLSISLVCLVVLTSVVLGYFSQQVNSESNPTATAKTAPVQKQSLEEFLKEHNATGDIALAYKIAYENPQNVLSVVKCYCGCIKNNGHKNNRDCFINEDGSFDLMGLNCGLCVKTAIISQQMLDEGKSVEEISEFIDTKYGSLN